MAFANQFNVARHSDITITVSGDNQQERPFFLHKFPLVSNSSYFDKEIPDSKDAPGRIELRITDFPGGPKAFETTVQYCYGLKVDLTVENIAPVYCACRVLGITPLEAETERYMTETVLADPVKAAIVLKVTTGIMNMTEKMMAGLVGHCINAIAARFQSPFPELNDLTPECFVVVMSTAMNMDVPGRQVNGVETPVKVSVEQAVLAYLQTHVSGPSGVRLDLDQFLSIVSAPKRMDNLNHNRDVYRILEELLNHYTKDSDADMMCKGLHELGFWVCLPHDVIEESYKNSLIPDRYCVVALMAENRHLIRANAELAAQVEHLSQVMNGTNMLH